MHHSVSAHFTTSYLLREQEGPFTLNSFPRRQFWQSWSGALLGMTACNTYVYSGSFSWGMSSTEVPVGGKHFQYCNEVCCRLLRTCRGRAQFCRLLVCWGRILGMGASPMLIANFALDAHSQLPRRVKSIPEPKALQKHKGQGSLEHTQIYPCQPMCIAKAVCACPLVPPKLPQDKGDPPECDPITKGFRFPDQKNVARQSHDRPPLFLLPSRPPPASSHKTDCA